MKIYITGIGIVSAIGLHTEENLEALRSLRTGIRWSSAYNLLVGEVPLTNAQLVQQLHLPPEDYSRTTLLALRAATEAWGDNRTDPRIRTGLVSSTSVGGLDRTESYYFQSLATREATTYPLMVHDNGRTTERVAAALGISGHISTLSTACSSGANALMQGARLLQGHKLDRVIAGGSEPLATFDAKGFSSLGIYDPLVCKPFDEHRAGLNLGEGAAFLLLENEHSLSITGHQPLCTLSGWGNATDAFHQTASSPEGLGAYLAMQQAMAQAGVKPAAISYINAHGTGTGNNDLSESMALQKMFGAHPPPFSSTKGFTGHTLAAAGAIEGAYCVLSLVHQVTLPNINFSTPMNETGLRPETDLRATNIHHALSNSFGFGGNCTCLIFSKA